MPWESGRTDVAGRQGTLGDHLRKSKHRAPIQRTGSRRPGRGPENRLVLGIGTVRRQHFARTPAFVRREKSGVMCGRLGSARGKLNRYGCSHVSGLLARCSRPLALMKCAGWVPLSPTTRCPDNTSGCPCSAVTTNPPSAVRNPANGPSTHQQDAIDRDGREVETDQT